MSTLASGQESFFKYDPSMAAAVIFIVVYLIVGVLHCVDLIHFSKVGTHFKFTHLVDGSAQYELAPLTKYLKKQSIVSSIPIILGTFFEVAGYAVRAVIVKQTERKMFLYILMQFFTLLAPSLISAGIFMVFNRIEKFLHAQKYSLIPSRILTITFVTGDVFSFLIQASGGGLMVNEDNRNLGFNLALVGFGLQVFFFMLFVVVALRFLWLIHRNPTDISISVDSNELQTKYNSWKFFAYMCIVSMLFIVARCVLRLVEFGQGRDGVMIKSEAAYYLIDPVPVLISCIILLLLRTHYRLWDLGSYEVWNEKFTAQNTDFALGGVFKNEDTLNTHSV